MSGPLTKLERTLSRLLLNCKVKGPWLSPPTRWCSMVKLSCPESNFETSEEKVPFSTD